MEPMTPLGAAAAVLGLAGKAWDLGRYVQKVYQGTKTVDSTIRNLGIEVNDLAGTCDLVHDELASVLMGTATEEHDTPYDRDGKLEKRIRGQVAHCGATIEELRKMAEELWPRRKRFVDRTIRQLRLQEAKEQIDDIRVRIRSHTSALHTILHILNIKVAHIAPAQAMCQLPEQLDDLRESISRIEIKLDRSLHDETADSEMPALVEYARDTLQSGMTLFDESVTGSDMGVDSVIGGEQAAVTNKTVAEWILSTERTGNERHDSPLSGSDPLAHVNVNMRLQSDSIADSQGNTEYDSDDDEAEFAKAAFDAGGRAFDEQHWQLASEYLITSKTSIMELPVSHRKGSTLSQLQYKIAVCSYRLGLVDRAESELKDLLQIEPDSDEQRIQQCDATHTLAQIYIHRNRLVDAKKVCKSTLKARSRLLGKQHEARLESIALLSCICELLGEAVHSEIYMSMLPEDQKQRLVGSMSAIRPYQHRDSPSDELVQPEPPENMSPPDAMAYNSTKENACSPRGPSQSYIVLGSTSSLSSGSSTPSGGSVVAHDNSLPEGQRTVKPDSTSRGFWGASLKSTTRKQVALSGTDKTPNCGHQLPKSVQALLDKPDEDGRETALSHAIFLDDADAVNALLRFQPPSRVQSWLSIRNSTGSRPLTFAMRRARNYANLPLDIVRSLLDAGADLKDGRRWRGTPEEFALSSNRDDLVALIKSRTANISKRQRGDREVAARFRALETRLSN